MLYKKYGQAHVPQYLRHKQKEADKVNQFRKDVLGKLEAQIKAEKKADLQAKKDHLLRTARAVEDMIDKRLTATVSKFNKNASSIFLNEASETQMDQSHYEMSRDGSMA